MTDFSNTLHINENEILRLADSTQYEKSFLSMLLEHSCLLISASDNSGRVLFASRHFENLENINSDIDHLHFERQLYPNSAIEQLSYTTEKMKVWELCVKHKDGSHHTYRMKRMYVEGKSGPIFFNIGEDISANKVAHEELQNQKSQIDYVTYHDPLTGLANRSLFYDRMNKSLARAKKNDGRLALMLIDIDRFKKINDSLGSEAGDVLLQKTAKNLQTLLRDTDTVARLSGDEFVLILENIHEAEDIEVIAKKIHEKVAEPLNIHGHEISSTASIGISLYPKDGDSTDKLLKHADIAMSRAKCAGKNRHQFFFKNMTESAVNYLLLENELRKAIEKNQLELHYQPQIDLTTYKIVGLEALVRWAHPEKGVIAPIHFIPLAEETGLIEPIGEWVLNHACVRFKKWLDDGLDLGKIAVNLSARQFRQDNFEKLVLNALEQSRLPSKYLELEITESSAMENAGKTISMLNDLSSMGLSLAIDDFGTGYSSLNYLQQFPIQKLKVDRSFIKDIDTNKNDAAIAKSIIDLGHNMSLQVIAEGVERESQCKWLSEKGCDQVQGFYYSRPLSEEKLMKLVLDEKKICRDNHCIILNI